MPQLMTESNTPVIERRIRRWFRASQQGYRFGLRGERQPKLARHRKFTAHFEHGQWWITDFDTGAQWSVCDSDVGFVFEQVTRGEDE